MTTRAIRGWTLGNPAAQYEKKDRPWLQCECAYNEPYLHSLVVKWFHWPGPKMELPDDHRKAVEMVKEQGLTPGSGARAARHKPPGTIAHEEGLWFWCMDVPGAGFYSYNPAHIERMGNWTQVGVLGVVTLYGTVAEHERGYRSEGVRIDKLWVLQEASVRMSKDRVRDHLEETYRCDVIMLEKMLYEGFQDWLEKEEVENLI